MLAIRNGGQTEALTKVSGYELFEEVNGPLTLSLTSYPISENPGHKLVKEDSIIEVDRRYFRVKQLTDTRSGKSVKAISTYFDLVGHQKHDIYGGTHTLQEFTTWLFAGTGWTVEVVGLTERKLIPNFGKANLLKLVEILLDVFDCERLILANNRIRFVKQVGPDNGEQYRYAHNIKTLSRSIDTSNLRTSIKGYGGNGLVVTYTSPNASKFPHAGEADPITDEEYLVADKLIERIKPELNDEPEVAIELEALELTKKELGERVWLLYSPLDIRMKSRILSKTTRKPESRSSCVIGNRKKKTITNALVEQKIDLDKQQEEITENAKQSNSRFDQTDERISMEVEQIGGEIESARAAWTVEATVIRGELSQVRTYTDTEIAAVREDVEDEIDGFVGDMGILQSEIATLGSAILTVKEEASTQLELVAGAITAEVSTVRTYAAQVAGEAKTDAKTYTDGEIDKVEVTATSNFSILSGRINSKAETTVVSQLGTRVNNVEFDLNSLEGTISQKVSTTDYTGNKIASLINQSATTIDIVASKINLQGAVSVLSDISGALGNITSGNINITNNITVGNTLYVGGSQIGVRKNVVFNQGAQVGGYHDGTQSTIILGSDILDISASKIVSRRLVKSFNNYDIVLAWNGANRLYIDINGDRKGFLQLDTSAFSDPGIF